MGVRSLGNALASFGYKFGTTGLEAVSSAPEPSGISASGGTKTTSGDYTIHTFTSDANFIVASVGGPGQVEYLILGGGGGGGKAPTPFPSAAAAEHALQRQDGGRLPRAQRDGIWPHHWTRDWGGGLRAAPHSGPGRVLGHG